MDSILVPLSTLLTNKILSYYTLDQTHYTVVYTILVLIIQKVYLNHDNLYNSLCDVWYIFPIILVGYSFYYIINKYSDKFNFTCTKYTKLTLMSHEHHNVFCKYICVYDEFFNQKINYIYPDGKLAKYVNRYPELNVPIYFIDKKLNVKGYYLYKLKPENKSDESSKYTPFIIEIYYNGIHDVANLYFKMKKLASSEYHDNITLYYVKAFQIKNGSLEKSKRIIYEGPKLIFSNTLNDFMKDFFHQKKQYIINLLKSVNNQQGINRMSLLLYGRPGTGKSSLAYRIARILNRNLLVEDLRIMSKQLLYQTLISPEINGIDYTHKDVVYLYDEFDIGILELQKRENNKNKLDDLFIENMIEINKNKESNNTSDKELQTKTTCNKEILYDLTVRDLLELIQGCDPMDGAIILATTNKYDEIRQICPELFRPGRFTPVYIDYISREVFNELTMYYFQKVTDKFLPKVIELPTSQLVEMAQLCKLSGDTFENFIDSIQELLRSE